MPSKAKTAWFRFDAGVLPFLEVQAVQETMAGDETLSINVQYGVVQPFADAAPGISIGVLDLLNQTDLGRSPFIAMTWQFNTYADWATKERASFTLGGGLGGLRDGAFVGVELPLFKRTNFVGEYDRRAITAGFDIEASKGVAVRALFREGAPIIGVQVRRRF